MSNDRVSISDSEYVYDTEWELDYADALALCAWDFYDQPGLRVLVSPENNRPIREDRCVTINLLDVVMREINDNVNLERLNPDAVETLTQLQDRLVGLSRLVGISIQQLKL